MKIRKQIAYCYPTSLRALALGCYSTGGYYVEQQILKEDGTWSAPYPAIGCGDEAFATKDDPVLLALLNEAEGEE